MERAPINIRDIPGWISPEVGGGGLIPIGPHWAGPSPDEEAPIGGGPRIFPTTSGDSTTGTAGVSADTPLPITSPATTAATTSATASDASGYDETTILIGAAIILGVVILLTGGKS